MRVHRLTHLLYELRVGAAAAAYYRYSRLEKARNILREVVRGQVEMPRPVRLLVRHSCVRLRYQWYAESKRVRRETLKQREHSVRSLRAVRAERVYPELSERQQTGDKTVARESHTFIVDRHRDEYRLV